VRALKDLFIDLTCLRENYNNIPKRI